MTMSSLAEVQHAPGTGLTDCMQCKPGSCSDYTETRQPLAESPGSHTSRAPHKAPPVCFCTFILGKELVQCFTTGTKTVPLDSKDLRNSPLWYSGIDFPREAEECDTPIPIVRIHHVVSLLKKDHHPVQRHCPWCCIMCDAAMWCCMGPFRECWQSTVSSFWGAKWFAHFLVMALSIFCQTQISNCQLQNAWPVGTYQWPQKSRKLTMLDRTPLSAWRHSLPSVSMTWFRYFAMTGKRDPLLPTAQNGGINSEGREHGPLKLNVTSLTDWSGWSSPGSDWGFNHSQQSLIICLGPHESIWPPSPPVIPIHHKVVISWQFSLWGGNPKPAYRLSPQVTPEQKKVQHILRSWVPEPVHGGKPNYLQLVLLNLHISSGVSESLHRECVVEVSTNHCQPIHNEPIRLFFCGWWAYGKAGQCCYFGLCLAWSSA